MNILSLSGIISREIGVTGEIAIRPIMAGNQKEVLTAVLFPSGEERADGGELESMRPGDRQYSDLLPLFRIHNSDPENINNPSTFQRRTVENV